MKVVIRLYKRYDADIIGLLDAGYDIVKIFKDAIESFANARPFMLYLDESRVFSFKCQPTIRFNIEINDVKSVEVLCIIKHGYRNAFCKALVRNALMGQNVSCYLGDVAYYGLATISQQYKFNTATAIPVSMYNKATHKKQQRVSVNPTPTTMPVGQGFMPWGIPQGAMPPMPNNLQGNVFNNINPQPNVKVDATNIVGLQSQIVTQENYQPSIDDTPEPEPMAKDVVVHQQHHTKDTSSTISSSTDTPDKSDTSLTESDELLMDMFTKNIMGGI